MDGVPLLEKARGRAPEDIVEDALAGYLEEVASVRKTLDSHYDALKSGRVKPIDARRHFGGPESGIQVRRWQAGALRFLVSTSGPGCLQERGSDRGRHLDRDEAIGGEEIVLTALVDDSKVAVPLGLVIGQDGVDLIAFERCLAPRIAYADRERRRCRGLTSR